MTPDAYYWISLAYVSIAGLTSISLFGKAYEGHRRKKRSYDVYDSTQSHKKPIDYILHVLHIPPYMIAAYWYYDSYKNYKV